MTMERSGSEHGCGWGPQRRGKTNRRKGGGPGGRVIMTWRDRIGSDRISGRPCGPPRLGLSEV
jgi:hypothetical protein